MKNLLTDESIEIKQKIDKPFQEISHEENSLEE